MDDKNILVVDDEKEIRNLYSEMFSLKGYTVKTAESAKEAIEILEKDQYQVMFLDLFLPDMNGVELCRYIHKEWPTAICYAVTGYGLWYEEQGCKEAGFEDYFTKPAGVSDLVKAVEHAFKKLERRRKGYQIMNTA